MTRARSGALAGVLAWMAAIAGLAGAVPAAAAETFQPIVFEPVTDTGIDFYVEPSRSGRQHQPETMISGVALFDYDNDGKLDIFAVSGATMPGLKKTLDTHDNRLYRNLGNWRFEDVTEKAGLAGHGYTNGVITADYDNDGDQDIFVAGLRYNILYRNEGDGTFTDVTKQAGLLGKDPDYGTLWAVAGAFFDYDLDGHLDLFVSNYCVWDPETEPPCGPPEHGDYCHPSNYDGLPNSLYRNRGDGTFEDVSAATGIRDHIGKGMGIGVADFDDDGWLDAYVANDTLGGFLFRNVGGERFEEIGFESGTSYTYWGTAVSGMGVEAKDVDNDGRQDIFVAAMTNEAMPLYRNIGDNLFEEETMRSGLSQLTHARTGWSTNVADLNNDGWKDIFIASGGVWDPNGLFGSSVRQANTLIVNLGNGRFADAGPKAGKAFAEAKKIHRGSAIGDIDDDGRLDVIVTSLEDPIEIWRNVSPTPNNWLRIDTVGTRGNRDGMNTEIRIKTASGIQVNQVNTAAGYGCSSDKRVHFGLGKDTLVEEIRLTWPNGTVQTVKNVKANQTITITEPAE